MNLHVKKMMIGAALSVVCCWFGLEARAADVTLAWNPPQTGAGGAPLSALTGYRLYYGLASGQYEWSVDVGNATSATLAALDQHNTYYFAVRACMVDGTTGALSEEVVWANDANANSLSDSWEVQHFGAVNVPRTGADEDFDGDGVINRDEYVAGTDPADQTSRAVLELAQSGEPLILAFEAKDAAGLGYAGRQRVYTLEACDDLSNPAWNAVPGMGRVMAHGQVVQYDVAAVGTPGRFYRLLINLE